MDEAEPARRRPAHTATRIALAIEGDVASTVYGTVVAMATLTAAFATESHPAKLELIVGSSTLVLWLAHLHAHLLGESLETGRRIAAPDVKRVARAQAGILLSAVPLMLCLTLGAAGVIQEHTAVGLAFAAGVTTLTVAGIRYSRLEQLEGPGRWVLVAMTVGLGLLIVVMKATISH